MFQQYLAPVLFSVAFQGFTTSWCCGQLFTIFWIRAFSESLVTITGILIAPYCTFSISYSHRAPLWTWGSKLIPLPARNLWMIVHVHSQSVSSFILVLLSFQRHYCIFTAMIPGPILRTLGMRWEYTVDHQRMPADILYIHTLFYI